MSIPALAGAPSTFGFFNPAHFTIPCLPYNAEND
jgi:hypothetical protein